MKKAASNAPFTPELETPLGWMSPTMIDRECDKITGRIMDGAATEEDRALQEQLRDIRRRGMLTLHGETPPRRRRKPL